MTPLSPQESLQLARFALDHADDGAFWVDRDGQLLYVNDSVCRSLALSSAELLAMTLFQLSPELTTELWAQLWKEVLARQSFAFEFMLRAKDRIFPVEMTVHHMPLPGREVLCAFFRDVNERKRLQQLKNEFVSTVSHELRTPMTIIRESVSQLLDGLHGEIPHGQREPLYITLSGIDRLARIINDLLDVSKMESGKAALHWERLDLVELIREIVETFASRAKERNLELRAPLPSHPVIVYADYDRLVQIFTNLVGNALKFSERGRIEIRVQDKGAEIVCAVSDTGIGIASGDLHKVFNKFEQLSRPAVTGEKGSGLGLSICKSIVEMHQGRIWVESEADRGATFSFTLPKRSAKDLFRQKMASELAQATASSGHLSATYFGLVTTLRAGDPKTTHQTGWAMDELYETIRTQGARKTDVLLEDSEGVWLGLNNTTRKEARRIVQNISEAYARFLDKNELKDSIRLNPISCHYPEEARTEQEFLQQLLGEA